MSFGLERVVMGQHAQYGRVALDLPMHLLVDKCNCTAVTAFISSSQCKRESTVCEALLGMSGDGTLNPIVACWWNLQLSKWLPQLGKSVKGLHTCFTAGLAYAAGFFHLLRRVPKPV